MFFPKFLANNYYMQRSSMNLIYLEVTFVYFKFKYKIYVNKLSTKLEGEMMSIALVHWQALCLISMESMVDTAVL